MKPLASLLIRAGARSPLRKLFREAQACQCLTDAPALQPGPAIYPAAAPEHVRWKGERKGSSEQRVGAWIMFPLTAAAAVGSGDHYNTAYCMQRRGLPVVASTRPLEDPLEQPGPVVAGEIEGPQVQQQDVGAIHAGGQCRAPRNRALESRPPSSRPQKRPRHTPLTPAEVAAYRWPKQNCQEGRDVKDLYYLVGHPDNDHDSEDSLDKHIRWMIDYYIWYRNKYKQPTPEQRSGSSCIQLASSDELCEAARRAGSLPAALAISPPVTPDLVIEFKTDIFIQDSNGQSQRAFSQENVRAARGGAQKLLDWQHVMYARLLHTSNVPTHILHRRFNFKDDKDTKDKATSLSRALNAQRKGVIDKRGHDFMHNVTLVTGQAEEIMYRIIKGIKTKPEPGDKNYQKWLAWWSDKWGWRGIRDSADNSLGEKMGGIRGVQRRSANMNNLFYHQLICSNTPTDFAQTSCLGCQYKSPIHTCPHEIMEVYALGFMNSKGRKLRWQSAAVTRHCFVHLCPVFHLGLWIFYRENVLKEGFIKRMLESDDPEEWHGCPLFPASTAPTSVGNSKATTTLDGYYRLDIKESNEVLTRVKRKIGLLHDGHNSSHGRKGIAAHLTEGIHGIGGISRDKIEHFANWFEDEHTVDKFYLPIAMREALGLNAGFKSPQGYFLPRRHIIDEDLLKHPLLWPEVDEHVEPLYRQCLEKGKLGPYSKYFLVQFLSSIRRALLQDLPLYMLDEPDNELWEMFPEFFDSDMFKAWQTRLVNHVNEKNKARAEASVEEHQPQIARSITHTFGKLVDKIDHHEQIMKAMFTEVKEGQEAVLDAFRLQQSVDMGAAVGAQLGRQAVLQARMAQLQNNTRLGGGASLADASSLGSVGPSVPSPRDGPSSALSSRNASRLSPSVAAVLTVDFLQRLVAKSEFNSDVRLLWSAWTTGEMDSIHLPVSMETMELEYERISKLRAQAREDAVRKSDSDTPEGACCKAYAREWRSSKSGKNFISRRKKFIDYVRQVIEEEDNDKEKGLKCVQEQVDAHKNSISVFIKTNLK